MPVLIGARLEGPALQLAGSRHGRGVPAVFPHRRPHRCESVRMPGSCPFPSGSARHGEPFGAGRCLTERRVPRPSTNRRDTRQLLRVEPKSSHLHAIPESTGGQRRLYEGTLEAPSGTEAYRADVPFSIRPKEVRPPGFAPAAEASHGRHRLNLIFSILGRTNLSQVTNSARWMECVDRRPLRLAVCKLVTA